MVSPVLPYGIYGYVHTCVPVPAYKYWGAYGMFVCVRASVFPATNMAWKWWNMKQKRRFVFALQRMIKKEKSYDKMRDERE